MNVSLNWLGDHLDLSAHSTAQLADLLTFAGIEVEGIEEKGVRSDKLVVAQVVSFVPHPNADKLRLCQVDDGSGTPRQIVCGAKNFNPGDKVPLAMPGTILRDQTTGEPFEIKEGKLRGETSQGMMCSGRELGIGNDHEGLMILSKDAPVGRPIHELMNTDTVFELEITPNRPDLLSHLGIARDLACLLRQPLKGAAAHNAPKTPQRAATDAEVKISAADGCPLYTARRIRGVKVAPSPDWLKLKLEAVGLRPINNIVDITNYVLMEMGQPLHAFDAAMLNGGIHVRRAAEGESFTALDGKAYTLDAGDLVIADSAKAVAIAGVMGGEDSGVTETTTDVLLESAYFNPQTVRRTSRRLALMSDSSYRFERGTDPQQVAGASELATRLILELAGGTAEEVLITAGAAPALTGTVPLELSRCRGLLGADLSEAEVDSILTTLGLARTEQGWKIPSYRLDLGRPVDLIEEVARVYGIANIPAGGAALFSDESAADVFYDFRMGLRRTLTSLGLYEAQTIKLVSAAQLEDALGLTPATLKTLPLRNPLSDDHTVMRPSIVPGLLATAERNIRQGLHSLRFFETGTIFNQTPDGKVIEKEALAILLSGPVAPISWAQAAPRTADLADLTALIERLVPGAEVRLKATKDQKILVTAQIMVNGKPCGLAGRIWPARERALDARNPVFVAEIDSAALQKAVAREVKFDALPAFPAVTRDVAMEAALDLANAKVEEFFAGTMKKEPLLIAAGIFDVFRDPSGTKLPADRKSVAYSLTYRDPKRTLTTAEVDAVHGRVLEALKKALPISIR